MGYSRALLGLVVLAAVGGTLPPSGKEAPGRGALLRAPASFERARLYARGGAWSGLRLPSGAVNLASPGAGAHASASSTARGFSPDGVLDGDWTLRGWGKGHGWQSAKSHEFPCWLEIRLPRPEEIDTVVVETFPPVMRGLNWSGIRNYDLQVDINGRWTSAGSVRGSVEGITIHRLVGARSAAIRINVNRVNNGNQDDPFYDDETYARVVQVGIYKLRVPLPVTTEQISVQVESGRLGNVAIFRDELPTGAEHGSSPEYLASMFREAGYGVTFLSAKALSVPEIFNRNNFDVFVQPYGPAFPVDTLLYAFLREGGHLITVGGHPFTRALMFSPQGELVDAGYNPGITTSVVRPADYFLNFREQLGLFYLGTDYLEDTAYAETAPDQIVTRSHFKVEGRFTGRAATALVGERLLLDEGRRLAGQGIWPPWVEATREGLAPMPGMLNSFPDSVTFGYLSGYTFNWPRSRWIPLVNAYDRLGKPRGPLLSLVANYEGPYRGSGWIFCGVENEDLFSRAHPEFTRVLLEGLQFLRGSVSLRNVDPELECYRQGETVKVNASVDNFAPHARRFALKFAFTANGSSAPLFEKALDVAVEPGQMQRLSVNWAPPHFDADLYRVRVSVAEGAREIDRAETGFVVWDPKTIAQGIPVDFRDNYFQLGGRPQLLVGARTNGLHLHGQVDEGVLDWDSEFAAMRDYGTQVVSPVFLSLFIPGLAWGEPGEPAVPEPLMRMIDAQVQLAQRHQLIYAPCIFFLAKYLAMERPELSRKISEEFGKRYASVPGIMFYIFDDGNDLYGVEQFSRWAQECVNGFSSAGRKYVVMAEMNRQAVALQRYGTGAMAFPSASVYDNGYPARYRLIDMRAAGKSFHNSEFGVLASGSRPADFDHTKFPGSRIPGSMVGDNSVYMMEPHLFFATGGSYLVNWDWSDPSHVIFPWGIRQPNDHLPKRALITYRNESYFFRHFRPAFRLPQVVAVLPRERLLREPKGDAGTYGNLLLGALNTLIEGSVEFAVLDDNDLSRLPSVPHVLLYPDARYATPGVIEALAKRVHSGDALFISGDFTRPVREGDKRRTELFEQMAGLEWISDRPAGPEAATVLIQPTNESLALSPYLGFPLSRFRASQSSVLASDAEGSPVMSSHRLGSGTVFFTSDTTPEGTRRAIEAFLKFREVAGTPISPRRPQRPAFVLPRADGGKVFTVLAVRPEGEQKTSESGPWIQTPEKYSIDLDDGQRVDFELRTYGIGLFATRADNTLDAIDAQGKVSIGKKVLLHSEPHIMAMTLDGQPLESSEAIALFPVGTGKVSIATASAATLAEAGEIEGGQFRPLENVATTRDGGTLTFRIDATHSRYVLLITSSRNQQRARQLMNAALR